MTATYNASTNTNTYTENTSNLHHSPVLGWSFDGCPIYGPYGYTSAMNASSGLSRMRSGFVLRNAANQTLYGTADLVAALGDGTKVRNLQNPALFGDPNIEADGNAILGHILGTKDASRAVNVAEGTNAPVA